LDRSFSSFSVSLLFLEFKQNEVYEIFSHSSFCGFACSATPASHMDLAKRAAITTQTLDTNGGTVIQVVDGAIATKTVITTVFKTYTETDTDASDIFSYSATDAEGVIDRLQMFFGRS
jgi:hypothetical protein